MHDSRTRLDDRYLCCVAHETNQSLATTRNTKIDVTYCRKHGACCLMRCRQEFNYMRIDAILLQHRMDDRHLCPVCTIGFFTTLQNSGIATLEAEREDIKGDIRPRLEDHTDDTERYTDSFQMQAIVQRLVFQHTT